MGKKPLIRCMLVVFTLALMGSFFAGRADGQVPNVKNVKPEAFSRPFLIEFSGPIDQALSRYLHKKLVQAKAEGADLVVVEIDSPGGLKSESLRIAETLRDIDWAYTVAFIPREAISGGALVSLGCDEIIVGTNMAFGDIGEIQWDPEAFAFRAIPAKLESRLVPQARDLATSKGRPPEFAESMVDLEVQVFRRPLGNGWEYKNVRIEEEHPAGWELIPESGPDRFLTLNGPRMLELGLADSQSDSRDELAESFGIVPEDMRVLSYTTTDKFADILMSPLATGLLIIIGLLALYLEMSAPGIGLGALFAILCAVLFFWSRFMGGTADTLEVILFLAGVLFLAMEIFVIPGWGVAGILGLGMMGASVFLAGQDFVFPSDQREWGEFMTTALVLLCSSLVVMIGAVFITKKLGSLPVFNRLILNPASGNTTTSINVDENGKPIQKSHPIVSVGDWGKAESLLRPAGRALFANRSVDVVSDGGFVETGATIKVVEISGNRIVVVEVEPKD